MNKVHILLLASIVLLVTTSGYVVVHHKKIVSSTVTSTISTTTESIIIREQQSVASSSSASVSMGTYCGDGVFHVDTISNPDEIYLRRECSNSFFGVHPWIFTKNGTEKKYGVIVDDPTSKCGCYESLGYLDYNDLRQDNGSTTIDSSSLIMYSSLGEDFSGSVSAHYFNGLALLILLTTKGVYTFDPELKIINKILTLEKKQDFCGPDLCTELVELSGNSALKVRVYTYSSTTNPYITSDEIKIISLK